MPADLLEIPKIATDPAAQTGLHALLTTAAFARLNTVAFIEITGEDRVRWLNGMVTNSVVALKLRHGCYCFFLNAQGRIQSDATVWLFHDRILLETAAERVSALISLLDRFIIMDDVELQPLEGLTSLLLAGPQAVTTLARLGISGELPAELAFVEVSIGGKSVRLAAAHGPLVPRFELWTSPESMDGLTKTLDQFLPEASASDLERLRVLEGTPRYGVDIRDRELPQETGQTRALHFSKGCYLGQEIVERIRSRGNVHRTLMGFQLKGATPSVGTPLFSPDAPDKPVGELTSVELIDLPAGPVTLALGYLRREALQRADTIHYVGGEAEPLAFPYSRL